MFTVAPPLGWHVLGQSGFVITAKGRNLDRAVAACLPFDFAQGPERGGEGARTGANEKCGFSR